MLSLLFPAVAPDATDLTAKPFAEMIFAERCLSLSAASLLGDAAPYPCLITVDGRDAILLNPDFLAQFGDYEFQQITEREDGSFAHCDTTGRYAEVEVGALELALTIARGAYQRSLVRGHDSLSQTTLKGRSKTHYWGSYQKSYRGLRARLADHPRLAVHEVRRGHGRLVLQILLRAPALP